ncbi:TolC family protein [Aeoliella mucimassa]|uniref:Cation efflux system protein CusC n=1 Tax=Aeoliella mucimassa TaxID=2527972 RepID=A0A518APE3_9BACT|nr:efflux transporter outer membrane subunit [Aeoliella mucimassa]QDU56581.1 Cation efflux system protein CusC precursor [Aeoliella mucimassa]
MTRLVNSLSEKSKRLVVSATVVTGILLAIPGCGIPQYCCAERGPAVPDSFNGMANDENSAQLGYREFFEDPMLTGLIDDALVGNQELKIMRQEIRIAALEVQARRGEYLPFVSLGAFAGLDKASRFTREGAVEDQLQVAPGKGFPDPLPNFMLAADVSWEIDIWKKLRNAKNAAAYRYLGTREGQTYVVTRLVAEVAENYYELMALDNRLETLEQTIAIQEQSLKMTKDLKDAGRATELAVQRFQAEVQKNQSERTIIRQDILEVENRLNFLLGRYPQTINRLSADYIDLTAQRLNVGVPSQLMLNRPDIRQAERELAAAGLDIKVARARFYPSLTLTAGVGYEAFNTEYLFRSPESLIYGAAGELVAPLINKKAIKAAYSTANAKQIQAVYNYQQTVLNAYTEVLNRISKVENYGQSIEVKKQQLASLESSVDNATKLFQNARAEYMEVLLAQRDMMEAKMDLIETKQQQLTAVVNAYQALGGGARAGFDLLNFPEELTPVRMPSPPEEEAPMEAPEGTL